MTEGSGHALEQALAYYRAPALLSMAAQRPLPDDVLDLIRLAAGDAAQTAFSAAASGEAPERVQEAAVFFVQQVLFAPGADNERVLGVNPGAPIERTREHYRWLVRWLHPDRNTDDWHSVYTDRVVRAWQAVKRSGGASTAQEDSGEWPAVSVPADPAEAASLARVSARLKAVGHAAPAEPLMSPRTARRLPAFVLGGLALIALSAVGLLWVLQNAPAPRHALASPPTELAPSADELAVLPGPPESSSEAALAPVMPDPAPAAPAPAPMELVGTVIASRSDENAVALTVPAAPVEESALRATTAEVPPPRVTAATRAPAQMSSAPAPSPQAAPAQNASEQLAAAPATPTHSTPPTAAPVGGTLVPTPPTEADAHTLLQNFSTAYAAGDINALMHLFTRDATNNRGGRDAIAYDYQSLFNQSRRRELQLRPSGWIARGSGAVVLARYEARVTAGLLRTSTTRGEIRFTLANEDGVLKISQVRHD